MYLWFISVPGFTCLAPAIHFLPQLNRKLHNMFSGQSCFHFEWYRILPSPKSNILRRSAAFQACILNGADVAPSSQFRTYAILLLISWNYRGLLWVGLQWITFVAGFVKIWKLVQKLRRKAHLVIPYTSILCLRKETRFKICLDHLLQLTLNLPYCLEWNERCVTIN
jgi:hypothetical protein